MCPLTTDATEAPSFRLAIDPTDGNGLRVSCRLMVDTLTAVPRSRLGRRLGVLTAAETTHLERAIVVFLGLA